MCLSSHRIEMINFCPLFPSVELLENQAFSRTAFDCFCDFIGPAYASCLLICWFLNYVLSFPIILEESLLITGDTGLVCTMFSSFTCCLIPFSHSWLLTTSKPMVLFLVFALWTWSRSGFLLTHRNYYITHIQSASCFATVFYVFKQN